jgi:hypothetical protein
MRQAHDDERNGVSEGRFSSALADGSLNVRAADNVVRITKMSLGVTPGSIEDRIVNQKVADDKSDRMLRDILVGVFAAALALAAAPLTGGASLGMVAAGVGATVGSATLTAGLTITHIQEFTLDKATHATDFDKARALSSQDPSFFWLALDILLAGVDAAAAVKAFGKLVPFASRAMNAGDDVADAAIEALARAAGAENPALGETVQRAVRRERSQRVPTKAKLEKKYRGENLPDNPDRHFFPDTVKYLTAEEREAQRIVVDGSGNLVWAKDGAALDTAEAATERSGGGRAIFVMDGHGNLYVSLEQKVGELHHSSLLAGADVAGAGELGHPEPAGRCFLPLWPDRYHRYFTSRAGEFGVRLPRPGFDALLSFSGPGWCARGRRHAVPR